MTLFLLIFLSLIVAVGALALLSGGGGSLKVQMVNNDWARALGWVVVAAIVALPFVAFVDRLPL